MKNISFRIEDDKLAKLDAISKAEGLDRTAVINNLIDEKIEFNNWQMEKIERALSKADKNEYSKDEEIIKLLLD